MQTFSATGQFECLVRRTKCSLFGNQGKFFTWGKNWLCIQSKHKADYLLLLQMRRASSITLSLEELSSLSYQLNTYKESGVLSWWMGGNLSKISGSLRSSLLHSAPRMQWALFICGFRTCRFQPLWVLNPRLRTSQMRPEGTSNHVRRASWSQHLNSIISAFQYLQGIRERIPRTGLYYVFGPPVLMKWRTKAYYNVQAQGLLWLSEQFKKS